MARRASHSTSRQITTRNPQKSPKKKRRKKVRTAGQQARPDFRDEDWPIGLLQRGDWYHYERRWHGRHKFSLKTKDRNKAIALAVEYNRQLERDGQIDRSPRRRSIAMAEFLEAVRLSLASKSPPTQKKQSSTLRLLTDFTARHKQHIRLITDFTPTQAQAFIEWRSSTPVARNGSSNPNAKRSRPSIKTLKEDRRIARVFFDSAVDDGWITTNPFVKTRIPHSGTRKRFEPYRLSEDEVQKLLQAAKRYDTGPLRKGAQAWFRGMMHDITKFFLLTGLRTKELVRLTWRQVDFNWGEHGRLDLRSYSIDVPMDIPVYSDMASVLAERIASKRTGPRLFENDDALDECVQRRYARSKDLRESLQTASVKDFDEDNECIHILKRVDWTPKGIGADLPLSADARSLLEARRSKVGDSSSFVFPHPITRGHLRSDYWSAFKKLLHEAGLPTHVRVHDLRHTFGMKLRDAGTRLETIQGLMRHSRIEDTLIYAPYELHEGAKAICCLDGKIV